MAPWAMLLKALWHVRGDKEARSLVMRMIKHRLEKNINTYHRATGRTAGERNRLLNIFEELPQELAREAERYEAYEKMPVEEQNRRRVFRPEDVRESRTAVAETGRSAEQVFDTEPYRALSRAFQRRRK